MVPAVMMPSVKLYYEKPVLLQMRNGAAHLKLTGRVKRIK